MAVVKMSEWEKTFESSYRNFLASEQTVKNERYRPEEETIFDALCSEEANFSLDDTDGQVLDAFRKIQ